MFKRLTLVCILSGMYSLPVLAAAPVSKPAEAQPAVKQDQTPPPAPVVPDTKPTPKKSKAKWSNASLDLTPCLNRETNEAIIKCAE